MQLLPSRASPGPEFASISLLLKGDMFGDTQKSTGRMVEPLLLPSSVSAISQTTCIEAVQELHHYINSILQARSSTSTTTTTTTTTTTSKMATALLQEDEQRLLSNNNNNNDIQVFRPLKGQGIGLHYRLLRDRSTMSTLIPLVFNSSKANNAANNKGVEKDVTGVIVCIGITGLPSMLHMSSLHYSLSQRLQDCLEILTKSSNNSSTSSSSSSSSMENGGGDGIMACKTLLTTLLLTEDEDRFSNTMAGGFHRTVLSDITRADSTQGALALKMKMKKSQDHNTTMVEEEDFSFFTHSADLARIMVERLAVLSVAENDTIFRKFETRTGEKEGKKGKLRKRKTGRDADLDGFDFKGEKRSSSSMNESSKSSMSSATSLTSESTSSSMTKASSISSSSSKLQLKQPKGDTRSRMLGKGVGKQTSVPALLASSRDGRSRRASIAGIDMNSARKNLKANRRLSSGHDWSFDTTNNSFATAQSARNLPQNHDSDSLSAKTPPGSINSRGTRSRPSNDNFDPFASNHMSGDTAAGSENSLSTHMDQFGGSDAFDSRGDMMLSGQRSIQSSGHSSLGSESNNGPKLQISIALNEDLTCFYKLSKMSSCNVEGVLQVCYTLSSFSYLFLISVPHDDFGFVITHNCFY